MRPETNYTKTTYKFDFSDFSLRKRNFKCKLIETYEENHEIDFSGKWEGSLFHKRFDPLSPKPGIVLVAGPVVFVVFVYIDIDFGMAVDASAVLTKYTKTITTYTIDLRELIITKAQKVEADKPWSLKQGSLSLYLSLSVSIQIGLGLYGKVISARFIVQPALTLKLTFPLTIKYADGETINDLKNKPGMNFSFDVNFTVGAFIDFSLRKLLGDNSVSKDMANQR